MSINLPYITIVVPNFNRGDLLHETLESILNQNYSNWEAIVVDDGSKDNSIEVCKNYAQKDSRIKFLVRNRKPSGAPVCRNIGVEMAEGDFIIYLDSDDLLAKHALSQRAEAIQKFPDNDFWVFPILMFRDKPENAKNVWNIETNQSDLSRFIMLDAVWQTSGPIWRKEAVNKINGFTEGLACWQDVDFHLKALSSKLRYQKFYNLKPDIYYRQHETGSISQGEISSPPKLAARKQILITHFERLLPEMNAELRDKFRILAGNIAIGSAKTLNYKNTHSILKYGLKNKFLGRRFILETYLLQSIYLLRLNRISVINSLILNLYKKYRQDSNIGKHAYSPSLNDK